MVCCRNVVQRFILSMLFFGLIISLPAPVFAADDPGLPMTSLQEVLQDVTKTDPGILEALENYRSVLAERSIARSEYFPTVGTQLSASPEYTDGVPTNDKDKNLLATTATLYARQNLFNGWKTSAFVDETDARIKAAAFEVLNVANRLYLDAAESYINVVKAKELLQIAERNAFTQEQIMRQVREKAEAGFSRVSELYNSESRLALSKGSFISRQQDLNQAVAKFHRQFGRLLEPEQFVKPSPSVMLPDTLGETVEAAFNNHPALKIAKYNIQTRQSTYEKATAAYWPTLDLELRGQYREDTGGEEGETTQAGAYLNFNYTLFDWGLRSGAKAKEQQTLRKERQRLYVERRNVNETVRLAWNIMEAEAAKKDYLIEHVMLSAKTLQAFKDEYFAGRRTLLDLLNMENEYTDAKLSETDSEFSYMVARYRIMQATGMLLDEHDTGLREMLGLPKEKKEDMTGYAHIASNRDKDKLEDDTDQCDNSMPGTSAESYGCIKSYVNRMGYPREDEISPAPYIAPRKSAVQPYTIGNEPAVQPLATVKEPTREQETAERVAVQDKIRLDVQPNSDLVTEEAMSRLAQLVEELKAQPETVLLVEAYIASDTKSEENTALSERRASLVKAFLVEHGIEESRVTVVGRGNENPLASNATAAGRKLNRRIEVTVLKTP